MDFDRIADTQEYEGNTIDVLFPKKRQTRKRKISNPAEIGIILKPVESSQEASQELSRTSATQRTDSQEPFTFTNDNIFRNKQTTSALFSKYFPPEVLKFTEAELSEINELYTELQAKQVSGDQTKLTQANVIGLDQSCLIERFLKETNSRTTQFDSQSGSSPSPKSCFDTESPMEVSTNNQPV